MRPQCEVCVDSLAGAMAAEDGGADRLELCGHLELDGVTPSLGLLRAVRAATGLPIMVMIRPRSGSFCYVNDELDVMLDDIRTSLEHGADGLVLGALTTTGDVCTKTMRMLMRAASGRDVTFHRAFDSARDLRAALETLVELGVRRVLTSGGASNVIAGLPCLRELVEQAGDRMIVMPGGGIRPDNVGHVARESGAVEFHFSASGTAADGRRTTSSLQVQDIRRQAADAVQ